MGEDIRHYIPDRVLKDIVTFAHRRDGERVILFGSQAKGTNTEGSDIDIAVRGGDFDGFYWDIKEQVHSLLPFLFDHRLGGGLFGVHFFLDFTSQTFFGYASLCIF